MRIRITFTKQDALRYTGHLDLHKIWERATRRAALPLAYSQGFHPQPKIQLAAALPLGFSSRCELADMWLDDNELDPASLPARFSQAVPAGIKILGVEKVDERGPALQTQVIAAEYEVTLFEAVSPDELSQRLTAVMEAASLPRERRGKPYDLRPLIEALALIPSPLADREGQAVRIFMRLTAREGATGRPEEVLDALGLHYENTRVERTRLVFK
jgi:radical SAM-linked protein